MSASRAVAVALTAVAAAAFAPLSLASRGEHARPAGAAPVLQSMIVGLGGKILSPMRTLTASATSVSAGRHSCAVAAGTPLAVLAATRRAGGPGYALRDYGRCGASPANSGQLFVYSLGGEMNRGQDGWEYKVNGRSGSTGAADPIGPRGDGRRLSSGAQVLWFWCVAVAGGCQRSLELSAAASVARGGRLTVSVRARDNEGRASAVAGAIVTLGSDFASTNASGQATLIAPGAPGSYQLAAKRNSLVPSFPETIVVR